MKKFLLSSILLFSFFYAQAQCEAEAQCTYSFNLYDGSGDGWNGNSMTVYQNGIIVAILGEDFIEGSYAIVELPLCGDQPFQLIWNEGGDFPEDVVISIIDPFGVALYYKDYWTGEQGTLLYDGMANCTASPCIAPAEIFMFQNGLNAEWSWTAYDTFPLIMEWEYLVLPSGSPLPTAETTGTITGYPSYTQELTPGAVYDFYVRSRCSQTNFSDWTAAPSFSLYCDPPTGLYISGSGNSTLYWTIYAMDGPAEVLVQPFGTTAPGYDTPGIQTIENSYTFEGLEEGEQYTAYMRRPCAEGYFSEWMSVDFTATGPYIPIVTNTSLYTPEQLLTSVLMENPCIEVSNVTSSTGGELANGIGFFTNTNPSFPLTSGIVLSTGNVANIPGPNTSSLSDGALEWAGDFELEEIITAVIGQQMYSHNASILEFDFTALNEFMSFNFLFASDEYGTYQCNYADAFAFLLTDLETQVTTNLAVIPGTQAPVSVVTIRDETYNSECPSVNEGYFNTFYGTGQEYASATNFNGQTEVLTAFSELIPNHSYHIKLVIADRSDAAYDSAVFIEAGSFTVGPPQCTDKFQLVAFVDENANGAKDAGEDAFSFGSFSVEQNNSGDVSEIYSPFGLYSIFTESDTDIYDFGYVINPEYAAYYSVAPTTFTGLSIAAGDGTQALYFPVTLTTPYNDVTVSIVSVAPPRPGFGYTEKVVYKNLGASNASGTLTYTKDPLVSITTVSEVGATTNANGFTYNFAALQPYETREILVDMNVPDSPTVNMDDVLTSSATITAPSNDIDLSNNSYANSQIVVNSYDPNDIAESHGTKISINGFSQDDYLYYTIRFQNIGTANAIHIRVEDMLDAQLDEESVRMISASHNYVLERIDNKLVWTFEYIQLPGILQDEELSKGYIFFKIKVNPGFAVGDIIPNTAEIYFDNNPAVITNTFETEFTDALAAVEFSSKNIVMFPNPAKSSISISLQNTTESLTKVSIHDVLGKTITTMEANGAKQINMDVSGLSKGIYLVEITTENQQKLIRKLVIK